MPIIAAIFLFLLCLTIFELYSLSYIAGRIGFINTLIVVLGTGLVGAVIARKNAKTALTKLLKGDTRSGTPARQMFDAVAFFIAAALLIIPGILTDIAGLILLMPFTRTAIYNHLTHGQVVIQGGGFSQTPSSEDDFIREKHTSLGNDEVIDVEAEDITDQ